jgi:uncharacterized circularly permuted ATP-grasp superfamily protein
MDPIPMAIAEEEWAQIERAIIQRATLLNAVLLDLYGRQLLVHERRLPPALVFANPSSYALRTRSSAVSNQVF